MKPKVNLLAIVGSQRKNGNSYLLAKAVLDSVNADYEIVQLANKEIAFCDLCEKCTSNDCVLKDDLGEVFEKMKHADGIVFIVPKYLFVASKFLCFLERLDTINHMRINAGYERTLQNPNYRLFDKKCFCMFVTSGTGNIEMQTLEIVVNYIKFLGLDPIHYNEAPFLGVSVKAGDRKGEVLDNKLGIEKCVKLVEKLISSTKR